MNNEQRHNHLQRFHRFQRSREEHFAPRILWALKQQYNQVLHKLKSGYTEHEAIRQISSAPIIEVLKPLYQDAATVYGAKIRADLNKLIPSRLSFYTPVLMKSNLVSFQNQKETKSTFSYLKSRMPIGFSETMRQLIEQYFQTDIFNTAQGITETTQDLIRQIFTDAYALGEGIEDIVKKLENTELSRMRSRMIARTESVTAANTGAVIVAKSTGLDLNKEWLSASDNRVRLHHVHLDRQVVPLDGYFHDHGVTMQHPGARVQESGLPVPPGMVINCRCTTIFTPLD